MPPDYVPPPWRDGPQALRNASSQLPAAPPFLPVERVDITFNAWWAELGKTPATAQAALDRTKKQLGSAMPAGYVPPPQRAAPDPTPKPTNETLLDGLLGAQSAPETAFAPPEVVGAESAEGKTVAQLRARQALLVAWMARQGSCSTLVTEVERELVAIDAAIVERLSHQPLEAAIDQALHGPSIALSTGAYAAAQGLPLGQVFRLEVSEPAAQQFVSDYLLYCRAHAGVPALGALLKSAEADEPFVRGQIPLVWSTRDAILELGGVGPTSNRALDLALRGPGSLGARAAERGLPLASLVRMGLSQADGTHFVEDYLSYTTRAILLATQHPTPSSQSDPTLIAFYQAQEADAERVLALLKQRKRTAFEEKEVDVRGSEWTPMLDARTRVVVGYYRVLAKVTKVVDLDGKVTQLSELPLEDPLKPVVQVLEIAIGFVPIVGEVMFAAEAVAGYDLAGDTLSTEARVFAATAAVPFLFKIPALLRTVSAAERILASESAIVKLARTLNAGVRDTELALRELASLAPSLGDLKTGVQLLREGMSLPPSVKAAFARAAEATRPMLKLAHPGYGNAPRPPAWVGADAYRKAALDALRLGNAIRAYAELSPLTAAEFAAAWGPGPYGLGLLELGEEFRGIGAFAKADPARTRVLFNAVETLGTPYTKVAVDAFGFEGAANLLSAELPHLRLPKVGPSSPSAVEHYRIYERKWGVPTNQPAVHFRPTPPLDPSGAFQQPSAVVKPGGASSVEYGLSDRPRGVEIDPARLHRPRTLPWGRGPTFQSLDEVAVLGGHGDPTSISGMNPQEVATFVADELERSPHDVRYLVLKACNQPDRVFLGAKSNAEAIQEALDAVMQARSNRRVRVLVADKPGVMYPREHKIGSDSIVGVRPGGGKWVPLDFIPVGEEAVNWRAAAAMAGLGVVTIAAAAAYARSLISEAQKSDSGSPTGSSGANR